MSSRIQNQKETSTFSTMYNLGTIVNRAKKVGSNTNSAWTFFSDDEKAKSFQKIFEAICNFTSSINKYELDFGTKGPHTEFLEKVADHFEQASAAVTHSWIEIKNLIKHFNAFKEAWDKGASLTEESVSLTYTVSQLGSGITRFVGCLMIGGKEVLVKTSLQAKVLSLSTYLTNKIPFKEQLAYVASRLSPIVDATSFVADQFSPIASVASSAGANFFPIAPYIMTVRDTIGYADQAPMIIDQLQDRTQERGFRIGSIIVNIPHLKELQYTHVTYQNLRDKIISILESSSFHMMDPQSKVARITEQLFALLEISQDTITVIDHGLGKLPGLIDALGVVAYHYAHPIQDYLGRESCPLHLTEKVAKNQPLTNPAQWRFKLLEIIKEGESEVFRREAEVQIPQAFANDEVFALYKCRLTEGRACIFIAARLKGNHAALYEKSRLREYIEKNEGNGVPGDDRLSRILDDIVPDKEITQKIQRRLKDILLELDSVEYKEAVNTSLDRFDQAVKEKVASMQPRAEQTFSRFAAVCLRIILFISLPFSL